MTFRDLAAQWWDTYALQHISLSTRTLYASQMKNYILPTLGDIPADQVDTLMLTKWQADLVKQGASTRICNGVLTVVSSIMRVCLEQGMVTVNPARGVKRLPEDRKPIHILTMPEVRAVAEECVHARDWALILMAALTGLRQGELFALGWEHITKTHVMVERALDIDRTMKPTKTRRNRQVPLSATAHDVLNTWRSCCIPGELVFPNQYAEPLRKSNWTRRVWIPARTAAKMPEAKFHHLRHTFASMAIASGANPLQVSRWMGHASITTTFDVYGGLIDATTDDVIGKMDEAAGALVGELPSNVTRLHTR